MSLGLTLRSPISAQNDCGRQFPLGARRPRDLKDRASLKTVHAGVESDAFHPLAPNHLVPQDQACRALVSGRVEIPRLAAAKQGVSMTGLTSAGFPIIEAEKSANPHLGVSCARTWYKNLSLRDFIEKREDGPDFRLNRTVSSRVRALSARTRDCSWAESRLRRSPSIRGGKVRQAGSYRQLSVLTVNTLNDCLMATVWLQPSQRKLLLPALPFHRGPGLWIRP